MAALSAGEAKLHQVLATLSASIRSIVADAPCPAHVDPMTGKTLSAKPGIEITRHAVVRIRKTLFRTPEMMGNKLQQECFRRDTGVLLDEAIVNFGIIATLHVDKIDRKIPESPYIPEQRRSAMTSIVTAAAVSKNFGTYQDAAVREPVITTKNGRPRTGLTDF